MRTAVPVHVAVATDEAFAIAVGAMLASLAARFEPTRPLSVHLIGDRLSGDTWNRLRGSIPPGRAEWNCVEADARELTRRGFGTRSYSHISPATYLRLLLPEILPDTIEKVLYLDGDLLVQDDVGRLWDTDITAFDLAAASELDSVGHPRPIRRSFRDVRDLGMQPDRPMFNVGVMLVNMTRWRETQLAGRVFTCLRCLGQEAHWYEQDALNVVSDGRYLELDTRWNARSGLRRANHSPASIIHFLTGVKPWHWNYRGPNQREFFEALDRTPWAGWRPKRPPLGRSRLLLARFPRALRKGRDAAGRQFSRLRRLAAYHGSFIGRPPTSLREKLPGTPGEIRLFLSISTDDSGIEKVLDAYRRGGVDRAFVLDRSGRQPPDSQSSGRLPVHWFGCLPKDGPHSLRRLLDRFGAGFWCVLGLRTGTFLDDEMPVDWRALCARLDSERLDLVDVRTGEGQPLELITRDLKSGRPFRCIALAQFARAWDPPVINSRAALIKYRTDIRLDASAALAGNLRRSPRYLRFVPTGSPEPS